VLLMITVLSGGVGAARLLRALSGVVPPHELTAVINVGDDLVMHGLTICPDLDTITYTLAGINDDVRGWGLAGESWRVLDELRALGGDAWFSLGDKDLATHLYRSQRLARGATKSDVTQELADRLGVSVRLLPVSNDPIATQLHTASRWLSFQEYFVQERHSVVVDDVRYDGLSAARPAPGVLDALREASRIVIAPSNPILSVAPVIGVAGVREILAARRDDVVAISPLIGGAALKGPADRLLRELGHEVSAVGVLSCYEGLVGRYIIDDADASLAESVRAQGVHCDVTTTIMSNPEHAAALARAVVA
jgi:LPPG:FO 2-phospho-L-lactate transferase